MTRLFLTLAVVGLLTLTLRAQTVNSLADEIIAKANQIKALSQPAPTPALVLTCPAAQALTSTGGSVPVTFPAPSASGGVPPIAVVLSQPSGSLFPVGVTTVTATATDAASQKQMCGFSMTVTVVAPPPPRPPPPPPPPPGLSFSTAFDCGVEWTQAAASHGPPCANQSSIRRGGDWNSSGHAAGDEVTVAANRPGSAGMGYRSWNGDGTNNSGGGINIDTPPSLEQWGRMYMRYEAGFRFGSLNYTKDLYFNNGNGLPVATLGFHGSNIFGVAGVTPAWGNPSPAKGGWNLIAPNGGADGQFHCYEWHVRAGTNGLAEAWIDGAQTQSQIVNFGAGMWRSFSVGENQATPANGRPMSTDYDDIAVSNTGRIGCGG